MEESLETAECRLTAASHERHEVSGAEKPVAVDGAEDREIARRENDAAHGYAREPRPAGLEVGHRIQRTGQPDLGKGGRISRPTTAQSSLQPPPSADHNASETHG